MQNESQKAFALYFHWPYCQKICPYCNFNVFKVREQTDTEALVKASILDMKTWREWTGPRTLTSIHFGGGTPSLLKASALQEILNAADHHWGITEDTEIGLEANPSDSTAFAGFAQAGITRLSLGIQSLKDQDLKSLGRLHDAKQALHALKQALTCFPRVSADMIYARPNQTQKDWEKELIQILSSGIEHISLYQLTVEEGTALEKQVKRLQVCPPDENLSAALYEQTQALCEAAGFASYEISNHARNPEARSKHNMAYWTNGSWIALGPGAKGRLTQKGKRSGYETLSDPKQYLKALQEKQSGVHEIIQLSSQDWANETLLLGLRLTQTGVSLSEIEQISGRPLNPEALKNLLEQNWIVMKNAQGEILNPNKPAKEALQNMKASNSSRIVKTLPETHAKPQNLNLRTLEKANLNKESPNRQNLHTFSPNRSDSPLPDLRQSILHEQTSPYLCVTLKGRLILDSIIASLTYESL